MVVFCTIGVGGFILLVISLLIGELAEHGGDIVHQFGDHDMGHGVEHGHGGPSFFSFRIIAALVTGFGGAGAIARYHELSYVLSSLIGIVSGFALAFVVYSIVKFLYTQQATSGHALTELVGKTAKVSVGIPEGAAGEITLTYKGATVSQPARSEDGKAVKNGEIVTIKSVVGDTVVISRGGEAR